MILRTFAPRRGAVRVESVWSRARRNAGGLPLATSRLQLLSAGRARPGDARPEPDGLPGNGRGAPAFSSATLSPLYAGLAPTCAYAVKLNTTISYFDGPPIVSWRHVLHHATAS